MKYRVVFELDAAPDTSFGDVSAVAQIAAASFERALAPVGECKLSSIAAVDGAKPVKSDLAIVEDMLTKREIEYTKIEAPDSCGPSDTEELDGGDFRTALRIDVTDYGYSSFFTELVFDDDGALSAVGSWED